jgi:hypothetical protein
MKPTKQVLTAWAEVCRGPGWSNSIVWVLTRDIKDGTLKIECLQPHEQSEGVLWMFGVSDKASNTMVNAVLDSDKARKSGWVKPRY